MTKIAILGFGVVGGGVAELITKNQSECAKLGGDDIYIKRILDLRDFPNSPFADRLTKNFDDILLDEEISTVIEAMGGSHPAYEYTIAALNAGKNVITSNKEVVANFGDEFLKAAEKNGVAYRFEAAVGGGIPVISPIISCVGQNKIREVRGILNGTTNYILTKMFSFGDSFDTALKSAQDNGYAERNPDADILGVDACRKIVILTALATGKLFAPDDIHTEGITAIRAADVLAARELGMAIKLLGRCIVTDGTPKIMVAPFMLPSDMPLANVNGVYNAVEVLGEPLGKVMFYGPGAGAGATASAMVGDLMQIMCSGRNCAFPAFTKCSGDCASAFDDFASKNYLAFPKGSCAEVDKVFAGTQRIASEAELLIITDTLTEKEVESKLSSLSVAPVSRIRLI